MSSSSYFNKSIGSLKNGSETPVSPTSPAAAPRNSALANKLTSVLSASYADSEIRDALGLLDLRGVENNADTRRRLRLDAQKEVIDCNGAIVQDFGKVAEQLKRIGTMISTLNQTCDEMRKHVSTARKESAPMLDEASTLLAQKEEIETRQELLTAFDQHFILSESDLSSLTNSTEPVNDRFFAALSRAKKVHEDCEVLLESENQQLGLELMDQTSRNINSAYKRLYAWIQKEFKTLNLEDPHISSSVRKALMVLAERPSLFQSCLDFFAEAREHNLSSAFHRALTDTNGTASNEFAPNAKPIEFSTHDLLRYVGDMLAWVHSAAVSEREALEGLFISEGDELAKGMKAGRHSEPWSGLKREDGSDDDAAIKEEPAFDGRAALASLVNRNLAGVTKTLRQRVEFAVRGNEDLVVVYRTMNLITFYLDIFNKLNGQDSVLSQTILDLQNSTFSHFEQLMTEESTQVSNEATLSNDLSAPEFLINALDRLSILLKAQSSSFRPSGVGTADSSSSTSLTRLVGVALTPFLDQCSEMANSFPASESVSPPDPSMSLFQLNYILPVRTTITQYIESSDDASSLLASLNSKITSLTTTLTELQHLSFLQSSGLDHLLSSLPSDISSLPQELPAAFSPASLPQLAAQLDTFLPSALMDAIENLRLLSDKALARRCTEEAVEMFCDEFERVVDWMNAWDERYEQDNEGTAEVEDTEKGVDAAKGNVKLRDLFPRRVEEVRVLLS